MASGFTSDSEMEVTVGDYQATEDGVQVDVDISGVSVVDSDGSENLNITIGGLGESATVSYTDSNGVEHQGEQNADGEWTISLDTSDGSYTDIMQNISISATDADDIEGDLTFNATTIESSNGSSVTISDSVTVEGFVSDAVIAEQEDNNIVDSIEENNSFDLNIEIPDVDGGKLGAIEIDIPVGAQLIDQDGYVYTTSDGEPISVVITDINGDVDTNIHPSNQDMQGVIRLTAEELDDLQVTPPEDLTGNIRVDTQFSAYEVDGSNNIIEGIDPAVSTNTQFVDLIEDVAIGDLTFDMDISLDDPSTDGFEYQIGFDAQTSDSDGSEVLSDIVINNIPDSVIVKDVDGAVIDGNNDGTYTIPVDEAGEALVTLVSPDQLSDSELDGISAVVTSLETATHDTTSSIVTGDDSFEIISYQ